MRAARHCGGVVLHSGGQSLSTRMASEVGSRPLPASPGRSQASVQGPRNNARVLDEGGEESGSGRKLARALLMYDKP
jgi:hypothetical protein